MANIELEKTIRQIFEDNSSVKEAVALVNQANSLNSISTDIYTSDSRFIYELIQNANDAADDQQSVQVVIELIDEYLVISHTGQSFTARDLEGLCAVGHGTKKSKKSSIGYKGIGFKSVFSQNCSNVYVQSEQTLFQFNRKKADQKTWNSSSWGDQKQWEEEKDRKFSSPWQILPILCGQFPHAEISKRLADNHFNVYTIIELDKPKVIAKSIKDLFKHVEFLLFLNSIQSIDLVIDDKTLHLYKEYQSDGTIKLFKNKKVLSQWWLTSYDQNIKFEVRQALADDNKVPSKLKDAESIELGFAFKIEPEKDPLPKYKLIPLKESESRLFTYLPTEVTNFEFPFLVNANFIVDAGREKIRTDHVWNEWLFDVIGQKMFQAVADIAKSISVCSNLSAIKLKYSIHSVNSKSLYHQFNKGFDDGKATIAFVKNHENELVLLEQVLLDKTQLLDNTITGNVVDDEIIANFLASQDINIQSKNIFQVQHACFSVLEKLQAAKFSLNELLNFLDSEQLGKITSVEANYLLLDILQQNAEKGLAEEHKKRLKQISLLLTNEGDHKPISNLCEPVVDFTTEHQTLVDSINNELFKLIFRKNESLYKFLVDQGLSKPSKLSYLEKVLLPDLFNTVTIENHQQVFDYIFGLHKEEQLTEEHYQELAKLPVLTTEESLIAIEQCVLSDIYKPNIRPHEFNAELLLVSEYYTQQHLPAILAEFFRKLGVVDELKIKQIVIKAERLPKNYLNDATSSVREGHSYPHLVSSYWATADNCEAIVTVLNIDFPISYSNAKNYWSQLFSNIEIIYLGVRNSSCQHQAIYPWDFFKINGEERINADELGWGRRNSNTIFVPTYLSWHLSNEPTLPSQLETLELNHRLLINTSKNKLIAGLDLHYIDVENEISIGSAMFLGIKLEPTLEDCVFVLKSMSEGKNKSDNLFERTSAVYLHISKLLDQMSNEEKDEIISEQNEMLSLLCCDKQYHQEIVLIPNIAHEVLEEENKPFLFLPTEVVHNKNFIEFLESIASKIHIADGIQNEIISSNQEIELTKRLTDNLPYVLALNNIALTEQTITNLCERLNKLELLSCKEIQQNYLYDNRVIHSEQKQVIIENNKLATTLPFGTIHFPRLAKPLASILTLDEHAHILSSAILSSQEEMLSIVNDFSEMQEKLLQQLQNNGDYQALLNKIKSESERGMICTSNSGHFTKHCSSIQNSLG